MARDEGQAVNDVVLSVRQDGSAWMLDCPDGLQPVHFASRAEAAESAQRLAKCLADAGLEVRILVQEERGQAVRAG
jgi:hypothetical protein